MMRAEIKPGSARGVISAPPSKSTAHRALIASALSGGGTVSGISFSNDISATLSCLESLGASVKIHDNSAELGGLDPKKIKSCTVDCGESGSTLRFLLPLCLMSGEDVTLRGTKKLFSRPMDVYEKLCLSHGFKFEKHDCAVIVAGRLTGGRYEVSMEKTSQFMTGLLFALSVAEGDSEIVAVGKAESVSYVGITTSVMKAFGADVTRDGNVYRVRGNTIYKSRCFQVDGDYSNAAALDALNSIGGDVRVTGLDPDSPQGDRVYRDVFDKISRDEEVDLSDCPDLAPISFALAAYYGGGKFRGTKRLKYKESDRVASMRDELSAFGVTLKSFDDTVTVEGRLSPPSRRLCGHNDHRVVMALSVLCTVTGGVIEGADAVSKSYPEFFRDLKKLGLEVILHDS